MLGDGIADLIGLQGITDEIHAAVIKMGRPSSYDPTVHPEAVLRAYAAGHTRAELAIDLGILPQTIWDWEARYSDFAAAIKVGKILQEAWWDCLGRRNLSNPYFNNVLYMMFRTNLHGWTRRVEGKLEAEVTRKTIEERRLYIETDLAQLPKEKLETIHRILTSLPDSEPDGSGAGFAVPEPVPLHSRTLAAG
jgi:DNA-binding XRE family transcriptional regulator